MSDEPLIYTSKGNVPVASLKYEQSWEIRETYIQFYETYTDQDGEVVRSNKHVCSLLPVTGEAFAAKIA